MVSPVKFDRDARPNVPSVRAGKNKLLTANGFITSLITFA